MAKRDIVDGLGRSTGERIARYVWRSKPTLDPVTGRSIRCIVAQDEKGQYWSGTRIGRGNGQKASHEYWDSWKTMDRAMSVSREATRSFLATTAELYSSTVTDKKPGEKIVTMDDGWSVKINAPGKISPSERGVMKIFDQLGSNKTPSQKPRSRGRSIDR
jgi:hypothetical protein